MGNVLQFGRNIFDQTNKQRKKQKQQTKQKPSFSVSVKATINCLIGQRGTDGTYDIFGHQVE